MLKSYAKITNLVKLANYSSKQIGLLESSN